MNNLTGSLVAPTLKSEVSEFEVRTVKTDYGTTVSEFKSKVSKCCICSEFFWIQDGRSVVLYEAFNVTDGRAYPGGLPDYLKNSHVLLQCHYSCKDELNKRLDAGQYI